MRVMTLIAIWAISLVVLIATACISSVAFWISLAVFTGLSWYISKNQNKLLKDLDNYED